MRPQQRLVAQKLAYARWHLSWSERAEYPQQQRESLYQSTLFHLVGAYRAFLAEIAADEHLPAQGARDFASAQHLSVSYPDYLPPALGQCLQLERDHSSGHAGDADGQRSWLAEMLAWFARIDQPSDDAAAPADSRALIAVSAERRRAPGHQELGAWLGQLEQLIDRLREDSLEY